MKKAFLESKWWFFIPIISLLFIHKITLWVFDGKDNLDMGWRDVVISFSLFLHIIPIMGIIMYIFKL